jgi:hypothetical protein
MSPFTIRLSAEVFRIPHRRSHSAQYNRQFVAQSGGGNQDADGITPDAPFPHDPQSLIAV